MMQPQGWKQWRPRPAWRWTNRHRREGERGTLGRTPNLLMLRSVFVLRSSLIVALFPPVSGAKNADNHHLRCNKLSERDGRL